MTAGGTPVNRYDSLSSGGQTEHAEPLLFEICRGNDLNDIMEDLARLRMTIFREWPYLYDGKDTAYERRYLEVYQHSPQAAVIVARDYDWRIVGASTCLPLTDESPSIQAPFIARGLDTARFFYFGESVLLPAWRGQGGGVRFFELREVVARGAGADFAIFCAVRRTRDHPACPEGWVPLDAFWTRRGYTQIPGLSCFYPWREVGGAEECEHRLDFWGKSLTGEPLSDLFPEDK